MSPLQIPESPDLFAAVKVSDEWSFFERLKQLACDVYAGDDFPTLKDRLRHVITSQGFSALITGRSPNTRLTETVEQTFERIYGESLYPKKQARHKVQK